MLNLVKVSLALMVSLSVFISVEAEGALPFPNRNSAKGCDDYSAHQPDCCRPQVVRPVAFHPPVRRHGCWKPEACYQAGCDLDSCCPVAPACVPAQATCAPAELPCVKQALPLACDDACDSIGGNPDLTELIQRSQTACHSWDRRNAVHQLSDRFKCCEYPAVMNALVYALSDPDERVRSKAADEIGDQLRVSPGCCSETVFNALKHALGDCDRFVRRQAEEALLAAGYDVVDGCCQKRSGGCDQCCVASTAPAVVPGAPSAQTAANPSASAGAATPRQQVVVNDATPTGPAVAPAPPTSDWSASPGPSGLTRVTFEKSDVQYDAPIPSAAGAGDRTPVPGTALRVPPHPQRRQPLRQSLGNLFNQR